MEVVTRLPCHSRIAGITRPWVLNDPGGPKARTEWHCSTARYSRPTRRSRRRSRRPRMIRPRLGPSTRRRRSCHQLAHRAPRCLRRRRARGDSSRTNRPYRKAGIQKVRTAAAYMPTGPGSRGCEEGGQAWAGSSQVPGRRSRTPSTSTRRTGRCWWWGPKTMAATWPISHTSPQAANNRAAMTSQKVSGTYWCSGLRSRSCHIRATSFPGSDGLGLPQAGAASAPAIGGVVGVGGVEGMAVLAVGLAGLGMTGRCLAVVGAAGAVGRDEAAEDPLRLAAPDAVLLAGADREGQAVVADQAGRADGDGLSLELRAVGEERVVVDRHDLEAGGQVAPGASVHAATPPGGPNARAARLAVG